MPRTDSAIQQAVIRELKWDSRVEETDVGVEVNDGIVTLTGTVSSWGRRMAAQRAAHRVAGVLDVANDIKVRLFGAPGHTDTEIAAAVRHALEWDVFVPHEFIRSTVSEGWVTLEGEVESWSQKDDAKRAVRNLAGVRGITDNVSVVASNIPASSVRQSIQEALSRQASREADRIELEVHDGQVVVSGVVHSWNEREAVIGAAKGTPGVRRVDDRLRIEPYGI